MPRSSSPSAQRLHAPSSAGMREGTVVLLLAVLLAVQPITTDLYLPALPALTTSLGAGVAQAQLTLTALLLAFGISQMVWGALSDRFGRRPILLAGLSLYCVAALGCVVAPTMEQLIAWRALQGVGLGAGVMGARAILRDLYPPAEGARAMTRALAGMGVVACLSPLLGGLLADLLHWRIALLAVAFFGAFALGLVAWRFEESLRQRNPQALRPATLLRTWGQILRHPTFVACAGLAIATYGGLFTFLAASSFVLIGGQGLRRSTYGLLMALACLSYVLGTVLCRRWLRRWGLRRTVALGGGVSLVAGSAMGLMALAGWADGPHGAWALMAPMCLYMVGHGIHQPCGQSGAVGPFPHAAGAASALNGFLMMVLAFGIGTWLGRHLDGSAWPLAAGVWFWSAVVALLAWTLVQRHGEPAHG